MSDIFSKKRSYDYAPRQKIDVEKAQAYDKGFWESYRDSRDFQTYAGNSYSREDNLHDEYEKEIENIKNITGEKIKNPYNSVMEEFLVEDGLKALWHQFYDSPFQRLENRWNSPKQKQIRQDNRVDDFYKKVKKLQERFPDLKVRTTEEIQNDIKAHAHELQERINDGREHNMWGDFAGSAVGSLKDPINAFFTLVTGGATAAKGTVLKSLGKTAVGEFLVNSGIEAVIQPSVYSYKKELELDYTAKDAVKNVFAAGVGGMALGTAGKAIHLTGKQVLSKFKAAKAKGVKFNAETEHAADILGKQIEFDEWKNSVMPGKDVASDVSFARDMEEAASTLLEEKPISTNIEHIREAVLPEEKAPDFDFEAQAAERINTQASKNAGGYMDGLTATLTYDLAGRADGLNVDKLAETVRAQAFAEMPDVVMNMTAGRLGFSKNIEGGKNFIRALFGENVDELSAKMAQQWKNVTEKIRWRFVKAGGKINFLPNWFIPTSHDFRLIQAAGREKWINDIKPLLDRQQMINFETKMPLNDKELQEVLEKSFDTLASHGLNKYSGKNSLAQKYAGERILHFKDADSWIKYNETYGNGDPFVSVNQYINNMANDIGFIETWGPNPEKLKAQILDKVLAEATAKGAKEQKKALKDIDYFNRIWDEVTGEANIPAQTRVAAARFNSGMRNLLMAAQLGSAALTTFSDFATNAMTAHFNGISTRGVWKKTLDMLFSNKKRDFAMHIGLGGDEIARILSGGTTGANRFLGDFLPEQGWTGRVAAAVIKASLLERMTVAGKKAFSLDFVHTLASNADKEFDSLIKPLKECFERYGLTSKDWDIIRKSKLDDFQGAKYVNLVEIAKKNQEVANKLSNLIFTERDFGVIDTNVRTHAIMTQGHKRGTLMGEMLRYGMMYKTFPVTIMTHHITRMMNIDSMGSKIGYLGGLFTGLTMTGYLTMQAKLLVSGKKPADAKKWNTWRDAMLAGGACGVLGDILFGETRGNLIADKALAIAGPGFSFAKDTYDLTIGNLRDATQKGRRRKSVDFWKDAEAYAKHYTPFTNYWPTKLFVERFLWDKLEMEADRKARKRFKDREKQQRYRYGRGYWWKPGKNAPDIKRR
ncbi:MAG: hypothetical protein J6N45_08365 [Alphaproteobacteria bacterium]|nr:hypothetical protein [Alphaproteobacteria bacterium]